MGGFLPSPLPPGLPSLVIVAGGGRDLAWPLQQVAAALIARTRTTPVLQLLHGAARGADQLIAQAALQLGWPVAAIAADWHRHGRSAGPIRNRLLLDQALALAHAHHTAAHQGPAQPAAVLVLAFPGGVGTASLVALARRRSATAPVPLVVQELA
ncbi:MAG: SLOG family protein [Synechococcaceae cyanobacterium]